MKYILVVGTQRSGTTFIHKLLKSHENVEGIGDETKAVHLFQKGVETFTFNSLNNDEVYKGNRELLKSLAHINKTEKTQCSVLKVALGKEQHAEFVLNSVRLFYDFLYVIHIQRNDLVAQYGSEIRKSITKQAHSWSNSKKSVSKLKLNKRRYISYANRMININLKLHDLKETNQYLSIEYDELFNSNHLKKKISNFLGVNYEGFGLPDTNKVSPKPQDYIINYDKLNNLRIEYKKSNTPKWKHAINKAICLICKKAERKLNCDNYETE